MCTVTFIPDQDAVCFTSNRDEQGSRLPADFPEIHHTNGQQILFPKDLQAGGTWIAIHTCGNTAVLLNGAEKAHIPDPPYAKSRGLILLDIISGESPVKKFEDSDYTNIEPFTAILFENRKLYACYWNGKKKTIEKRNAGLPQIWSSVTLYSPEIILKREHWFKSWIANNPFPDTADILYFHQHAGEEDPQYALKMNRNNGLFTQSISSVRLTEKKVDFHYLNLLSGKSAIRSISIQNTIPVQS